MVNFLTRQLCCFRERLVKRDFWCKLCAGCLIIKSTSALATFIQNAIKRFQWHGGFYVLPHYFALVRTRCQGQEHWNIIPSLFRKLNFFSLSILFRWVRAEYFDALTKLSFNRSNKCLNNRWAIRLWTHKVNSSILFTLKKKIGMFISHWLCMSSVCCL